MRHYQRGGALVEFAIVAPIALLLLCGAIEFGTMTFYWHSADYAAKSAARWASVRGADCLNTSGKDAQGNTLCPVSSAAVKNYVLTTIPGVQSGATVSTSFTAPPSTYFTQPSPAANCPADELQYCLVNVTVTNPYTLKLWLFNTTVNLQSTAQEIVR